MILIKNGDIHTGHGEVRENFDVLVDHGKILRVEKEIKESQCEIVDAKGCVVLPGFIDTMNTWGAFGPSWSDNDMHEHTNPVAPHLNSVHGFDPCAMNFQEVYRYGVTSFGLSPSIHNVIGGRMSVFKTYGEGQNPYRMLVKEDVGMAASISDSVKETYRSRKEAPMTKMGIFALLKEALYEAREAGNGAAADKAFLHDEKKDQLRKVLQKELPLFINTATRADIGNVEMLLEEFALDVVLTGAYGFAENMAEAVSKVVLGNLTDSMLPVNYRIDAAGIKKRMERGDIFSISSCGESSAGGKESLLWNGILYYQAGIEAEDVVQMLTYNPAQVLGISDRTGTIAPGKDADIAIWSRHPVKTFDAQLLHCFIDGRDVLQNERRTSCW